MRKNSIISIVAVLLVVAVIVYYGVNLTIDKQLQQSQASNPTTTPPPMAPPTAPPQSAVTVTGWGDPHSSYPSKIVILSPQNQTYQTNSITLKINATTTSWAINSVYYKADWLDGEYHRLYYVGDSLVTPQNSEAITLTVNFSAIPNGGHNVSVVANYHDDSHAYDSMNFSIDYKTQ